MAIMGVAGKGIMRSMAMTIMHTLNNGVMYFTAIRDVAQYPHSRLGALVEKLPMLLAVYVSSVLVGISTYNTFPSDLYLLNLSAAIAGGLTFDILLTSTVFARRKNGFSYLTVLAALIAGLLIALDLYLEWKQAWLHAVYIIMTVLYSLHIATTRGKPVQLLERDIARLEQELAATQEELAAERLNMKVITHDQEQIIRSLETQVATLNSVIEGFKKPRTEPTARQYQCKKCGHDLESKGKQLASSRWGCKNCKQ